MTDRLRQPPRQREFDDPDERSSPLPWGLAALVVACIAWGSWYILSLEGTADATLGDRRTVAALAPAAPVAGAVDGGQLFASKCAACHQANGAGVAGVFPPLAGSEWVTESPTRLVQILLHGIRGPIDVKGVTYNGLMPPWRSLSDDELAALATYVRASWGNGADAVTAATVAEQRAATEGRTTPWGGGAELAAVP
ncbi:MAG: cytochrome c [Gemmatimonadaceae bacterium]|nr:cytochrome c [Gemmatimonadaceae bacterium]